VSGVPRPFPSLYTHELARVAAAVPHLRPAEPDFNAERTLALAQRASAEDAALVVFPELGLSAYAIDDLFHQEALLDAVEAALGRIVAASADLVPVIVVGGPLRAEGGIFNSAVAIHRGRVLGATPKSYLPEYREYYEERQFRAARELVGDSIELLGAKVPFGPDFILAASDLPGFVLHMEVCEDLWTPIPPST
jgi:NAD+ synthase (glutamine-hydrolysing)